MSEPHRATDRVRLTETQLADRLNCSVKLIQKMRFGGNGPRFLKIGRLVRYDLNDVLEFELRCARGSTSDSGG